MNSCDFSIKSYSFDQHDMDLELKHFDNDVTHDVQSGMVSMIKQANDLLKSSWKSNSIDGLKMLTSPWSPPCTCFMHMFIYPTYCFSNLDTLIFSF